MMRKRILSFLMTMIMLFTAMPVFAASDITPPVITEVTFCSQTVSASDRYVYFTIKGYDSDGSAFSEDKSHITYYVPNCMGAQQSEGFPAESITDHGDGTYTFQFAIKETWYGPYVVVGLSVSDEYGNVKVIDITDESGDYLYEGTIDAPVSNDLCASNITIDGSASDFTAALTDTVLKCPFTFSADITTGSTSIPNGSNLTVVYQNANYSKIEFQAAYYNGTIVSNPDVGYGTEAGTYVLKTISYENEFLVINGTTPNLIVTKSNTDTTPPVVEDIWLTLNGSRAEGFVAQQGTTDAVKVYVKASDASDICFVEVNFQTSHPSYENPLTLRLEVEDPVNGVYAAEVPLDEYNATVWYVEDSYVYDIYFNMEPERGISPYYILKDANGDTSVPTATLSGIQINFGPDSDEIVFENPITIDSITSIKDILSKIGETLRPVNIPAGRTFVGWYIGNSDTVIYGADPETAAEKMFATQVRGEERFLMIAPKFDKYVVSARVTYFDSDNRLIEEPQLVTVDEGATIQDVVNQIDTTHIVHPPAFTFDSFVCDGYDSLTQTVNPCNTVLWYNARYSAFPVFASLTYYDKDGNRVNEEITLSANSTSTNADMVSAARSYLAGHAFDHYADLGTCVDWELEDAWYDLNAPVQPGQCYGFTAVYENAVTDVSAVFIDQNGAACWEGLGEFIVTPSTTYRDILNHFAADLSKVEHSSAYSFQGWTIGGVDLDDHVPPDGFVEIIAEYANYPVSISYSYNGDNGIVTDVVQKMVPAGTNMETLFKEYTLPAHGKSADFTGWKFFRDAATNQIVDVRNLDYVAAAAYRDADPVWVITAYVDKNGNGVQGPVLCYAETAPTNNSPGQEIDDYFAEVSRAAYAAISPLSKYAFTSFREDMVDMNLDAHPVFTNYSTAATLLLVPDTDKTQVTVTYPDGTQEVKVLDSKTTFKLPEEYKNKAVTWLLEHPFGTESFSGGEEVPVIPPHFMLIASYADGSQGGGSNSGTSGGSGNHGGGSNSGTSGNNGTSGSSGTTGSSSTPTPPATSVPAPTPNPSPAPTPAPTTPSAPASVPVKLGEEAEKQVISDIQQASSGAIVKVDMTNDDGSLATVVTKEMLLAVQDKDVTLVLDMGDYSWTIYGGDIRALDDIHDVNLEVTLDTTAIPPRAIQTLAGNQPVRQLSLTYDGDFGFNATLKTYIDKQYSGTNSSLYYYDSSKKLVFIDSNVIDAEGYTSLRFSHASDYVIVVEQKPAAIIENETIEQAVENPGEKEPPLIPLLIAAIAAVVVITFGVLLIVQRRK